MASLEAHETEPDILSYLKTASFPLLFLWGIMVATQRFTEKRFPKSGESNIEHVLMANCLRSMVGRSRLYVFGAFYQFHAHAAVVVGAFPESGFVVFAVYSAV